ncbi:MAG: homoserine O-acetyltransferase [Acidobacteria bacterium OLB17]|nr:MAG: homoserine O-acetyltransferase [Acidobacteria bacterium OLB17]MCZ2391460.1 alpha/beta fold hydrolase [Acidobacteriota bacterium]
MFEIDLLLNEPFELESGEVLTEIKLRTAIYGKLNADRSNAVLVFHALTGSARVHEWWDGVLKEGGALDPEKDAIVCVNYLGSCYGSTSAKDLKRRSSRREIPIVTTRDIVRSTSLLMEYLGIGRFKAVVGGSVGGMLALQFAVDLPQGADEVIAIAAAPLSAMGLALNHIQRQAVARGDIDIARKIALLSYRSPRQFDDRFGRKPNRNGEDPAKSFQHRFDVGGYLDHQGAAFRKRFELESYELLTKAMDLFDLTDEDILKIRARVSLVGISSDWLFPPADIRALAVRLADLGVDARYHELASEAGHDAFLSEPGTMSSILRHILSPDRLEYAEAAPAEHPRDERRFAASCS